MLGYLVCWTPYAVISFWNSFFDPNSLPVVAHCFPPLFAKASLALEPILFIVSNHRYKMALFELMLCGKDDIIVDASRERERSKAQVRCNSPGEYTPCVTNTVSTIVLYITARGALTIQLLFLFHAPYINNRPVSNMPASI